MKEHVLMQKIELGMAHKLNEDIRSYKQAKSKNKRNKIGQNFLEHLACYIHQQKFNRSNQ